MRPTCARFRGRRPRGPLQFIPLLLAMLLACGDDGVSAEDGLEALIGMWELIELDGGVPRTGETWTFTATPGATYLRTGRGLQTPTVEFPNQGQCIVVSSYTSVGSTLTLTVREFVGFGCDDTFAIGNLIVLEATVSGDTLTIVTGAPVGIAHHIEVPAGHRHVRVFTRATPVVFR